MYTGALAAVSNRETWTFTVFLTDFDTGTAIDLTGASIDIAVREQRTATPLLTGSTTDGKIVISAPATGGSFVVTFTPTDMSVLVAGMYDVGVRVTVAAGTTFQLLVATLPVVDGIVDP